MTPSTPPVEAPPTKGERLTYALLFGGLAALVVVLVLLFELDPTKHPSPKVPFGINAFTHEQTILKYLAFTAMGALGVLTWGVVRRWRWARGVAFRRLVKIVLIGMVFLSGFTYFYGRRGMGNNHYAHRYDTFHYLLAPRYYAELDYPDLYVCALSELSTKDMPDKNPVRDLRTYRMSTAGELREQDLCADNFTPERRARFREDLKLFTGTPGGASTLRECIADRGYNATPVHSAVAGAIADRIPLTVATHNMVPLLDVVTTCIMLYAAAVAFGWEVGLLFALSVFTNAADRWGIIGGSFFRYQWLVTLTLGLAALRRGRYAMAGMWMTASALLNVFPAVFTVGVLVRAAVHTLRERTVPTRYRRFIAAAALTTVIGLGIGALPARHLGNYTSWFANMENHNVERFQGFGTGLKFPFIYRGANDAGADKVPESARKKLFHENRPAYYALLTVLLSLAFGIAIKTEDDVEAATTLGFTLFFGVLGTVGYYFAVASVVVLGLHKRARTPGGVFLLSLWFVASFIAHLALYNTMYYRFMYNTVLSLGWTVWLTALLFWTAGQEGILAWFGRLVAPPARDLPPAD